MDAKLQNIIIIFPTQVLANFRLFDPFFKKKKKKSCLTKILSCKLYIVLVILILGRLTKIVAFGNFHVTGEIPNDKSFK
jgi:hypothetical protein